MIGLATAGRSQPASQSQLTLAGPLGHEDWDEHPMHSATVPGSVQVQVQVQVQVAERESKAWIQDANICIPTRQSALKSDMFGLATAGKSQPASQSRFNLARPLGYQPVSQSKTVHPGHWARHRHDRWIRCTQCQARRIQFYSPARVSQSL